MTQEHKEVWLTWEITKDSVDNFWPPETYNVYLSKDRQWWTASTQQSFRFPLGEKTLMSPLYQPYGNILEHPKWEIVRKYLIHCLRETQDISELRELDRFSDLEI